MNGLPRGGRVSGALVTLAAAGLGAMLVVALSNGPAAVSLPPSIAVGPMTTTRPPGAPPTTTQVVVEPPPSATSPYTTRVVVVPTVRLEDDQGDAYDQHQGGTPPPEAPSHRRGDS